MKIVVHIFRQSLLEGIQSVALGFSHERIEKIKWGKKGARNPNAGFSLTFKHPANRGGKWVWMSNHGIRKVKNGQTPPPLNWYQKGVCVWGGFKVIKPSNKQFCILAPQLRHGCAIQQIQFSVLMGGMPVRDHILTEPVTPTGWCGSIHSGRNLMGFLSQPRKSHHVISHEKCISWYQHST